MSLKLFLVSALLSAAEAFTVVAGIRPTTPLRATAPKAMIAPDALANLLPTTMTLAEADDISPLFLASGTGFLFIPLMVVAIVVINFGIMKK